MNSSDSSNKERYQLLMAVSKTKKMVDHFLAQRELQADKLEQLYVRKLEASTRLASLCTQSLSKADLLASIDRWSAEQLTYSEQLTGGQVNIPSPTASQISYF